MRERPPSNAAPAAATRILARTMYRRLVAEGYDEVQIVAFTSEVLGMLAASIRARCASAPAPAFERAAAGAIAPGGASGRVPDG